LAIVFLWFGVDKFLNPTYWLDAWVPQGFQALIESVGMPGRNFIFLNGIFEILVGVSIVSGFYVRAFSGLAALFLVVVTAVHIGGATEVVLRDVGLIGALVALAAWPERAGWA
jgi:uncharacterized membrane protein YphA (DoxX/SURF4 family)